MILNGNEDLRVQKTIEAINNVFEEMLEEMNYSKITVKELTERARINKKTFYRYYECLDELLKEKQAIVIAECLQNISGYKIPDELDKIISEQFHFFHSKGGMYEKLICSGSVEYKIDYNQLCENTKKKFLENSKEIMGYDKKTRETLFRFINMNALAIYGEWMQGGKKESLDEVIKITTILVCGGVNELINRQ
jgi:hypothetical protein